MVVFESDTDPNKRNEGPNKGGVTVLNKFQILGTMDEGDGLEVKSKGVIKDDEGEGVSSKFDGELNKPKK